jgi:CheY-like chemotaxis protein
MHPRFTCALIDDDQDYLDLEKRCLSNTCPNIDIVAFERSEEAVFHLLQHRVDLVITDYRMPLLDGIGVVMAVRSFDREVPILMVSENEVGPDALAAGANAFMSKDEFRRHHRSAIERLLTQRVS